MADIAEVVTSWAKEYNYPHTNDTSHVVLIGQQNHNGTQCEAIDGLIARTIENGQKPLLLHLYGGHSDASAGTLNDFVGADDSVPSYIQAYRETHGIDIGTITPSVEQAQSLLDRFESVDRIVNPLLRTRQDVEEEGTNYNLAWQCVSPIVIAHYAREMKDTPIFVVAPPALLWENGTVPTGLNHADIHHSVVDQTNRGITRGIPYNTTKTRATYDTVQEFLNL